MHVISDITNLLSTALKEQGLCSRQTQVVALVKMATIVWIPYGVENFLVG
jgi:hypothetical protein